MPELKKAYDTDVIEDDEDKAEEDFEDDVRG